MKLKKNKLAKLVLLYFINLTLFISVFFWYNNIALSDFFSAEGLRSFYISLGGALASVVVPNYIFSKQ